jgi:Acyclic terpene utilisation family protein AtuA
MDDRREIRVLSPTSIVGAGFRAESLERAMEWKPDVIACDGGSTDPGPFFLGSGGLYFSRDAIKRDLELMLLAARAADIPMLVGTAVGAGTDAQLAVAVDVVQEIAAKHDLTFRLAAVHCEPDREYLKERYRAGKIRPLANAPEIDESTFDRSDRIVAMAGVEPYQRALDDGADVVLSGRSTDAAIFASIPTQRGFAPGPAWHAAKILECSAACVVQRKYADPMFAWIRDDHFVVEPPNPDYRCSPVSVASHTLYENGSPYELVEPNGTLFSDTAKFEAESNRAVRVSGSRFEPTPHTTNKLEGAELVGYQTIIVGGVRDPVILRQLDRWLEGVEVTIRRRIEQVHGADLAEKVSVTFRRYGIDGVMGALEPTPQPAHEVGVIVEITAPTQEIADSIGKAAAHVAAHYAVPEYSGLITALAFPYSPGELSRGPVYRFTLNHVVEPESPLDPFRIEMIDV